MGLFAQMANAAFRTDERGRTLFYTSDFYFWNRRAYVVPSEEDAERIKRRLRACLRIFFLLVVPAVVVALGQVFPGPDLLPHILTGLVVGAVFALVFHFAVLRPALRTLERSSETVHWRQPLEIQVACYSWGTLLFFAAICVLFMGLGIFVLSSGRTTVGICTTAIAAVLGVCFARLMLLKRRQGGADAPATGP